MERRTVRIYKAPNGQGEYINKTAKFLKKAQMGAETESDSSMQQKQLEPIVQFVTGALADDMQPEEVMKILVSKGLPKELVYSIISSVLQQQEAPEEEESADTQEEAPEESKIGQSEYQPIGEEESVEEEPEQDQAMDHFNSYANEDQGSGVMDEEEYAEGGPILSYNDLGGDEEEGSDMNPELLEKLSSLKNFFQQVPDVDFENFGKDISEYQSNYTPIEWDNLGDGYGLYKKGGSKKNFTKNVLALVKKAEGGDTQEIGKGNKKDTLTNEVSKRKTAFVSKLKEISNKAAVDSIYEKMMKSNDPELMQSAQELAQNRQKNSQMGTFEPMAQQGGYIGEGQPDMFSYGGFDIPQARKGIIQKAGDFILGEQYLTANNPYSVTTGAMYRDPVSKLTPYARTVHRKGILGRPKEWTDYYVKGDVKSIGIPGEKIETKKTKDKEEAKLKHGYTEEVWDEMSGKARRAIRRGERRLNRRKDYKDEKELTMKELIALQEQERKKQNDAQYKERKDAIEQDNKRIEEEKKLERVNDPERKKADWETINDRINNTIKEYNQKGSEEPITNEPKGYNLKDFLTTNADNFKDAEDIKNYEYNPDEFLPQSNQNELLLNNSDQENFLEFYKIPMLENLLEYQKQFLPSESFDQRETYEFKQYGGSLHKAALGVQSPTSTLSGASDPTANTQTFSGVLNMANQPKKPEFQFPMKMETSTEEKSAIPDWLQPDTWMDSLTQNKNTEPKDDDLVAQDIKRKRKFDGTKFNNKLNATFDITSNALRGLDTARQSAEMYQNNFNADSIYGASTDKDRGDYVAYGQQTGMFRPDETGQETMGRFAYGQRGGYMQDGGQSREEILKQFTGTPEFKRGLDLMMQRENTDNADPFYDAMRDANYSEEDYNKYRDVIGSNSDWQNIVPQKSDYTKTGRHRELQDLMNKAYGSERYNTPYAVGSGGPRRENENYYPMDERRPTPFEDGRIDPRTLEALQNTSYEEYEEGGVVDMDEDELREFLANGGEVEYL